MLPSLFSPSSSPLTPSSFFLGLIAIPLCNLRTRDVVSVLFRGLREIKVQNVRCCIIKNKAGVGHVMRALLFVLLGLTISDSRVTADGKYYVPPDVPRPEDPSQRALIIHDSDKEFLLIQAQAVGRAEEFGWVIPVPAVPAVGSLDREKTDKIFWSLASQTEPRVRSRSDTIFGVVLVLFGIAFLSALAYKKWVLASMVLVLFLLVVVVVVPLGPGNLPDQADVAILASARVGVYDTKVLRAGDPSALKDWLTEHGFRFDAEDEKVFQSYIDRSWCFVAARVAREASTGEGQLTSYGGFLPPLALLFDSLEPVYPWALTATVGYPVELLLYVAATSCVESSPLDTKYSGSYRWSPDYADSSSLALPRNFKEFPGAAVTWSIGSESKPESVRFSGARWLTKLQATIIPGTAEGDLALTPAPNRFYRPTIWR